MSIWAQIATLILSGGTIGGIAAFIKARADARAIGASAHQTAVQTEIAEDTADDEHWRLMVETQVTGVIGPLREQVNQQGETLKQQGETITEQGRQITALETEVRSIRRRYHAALDTLRSYVRYTAVLAGLLNDAGISAPPPPVIPAEINDDY